MHYIFYFINMWFWISNIDYKGNNFIQKLVIGYINTTYNLYILQNSHIPGICITTSTRTLLTVILCAFICSTLLFKGHVRKWYKSYQQCVNSVQHDRRTIFGSYLMCILEYPMYCIDTVRVFQSTCDMCITDMPGVHTHKLCPPQHTNSGCRADKPFVTSTLVLCK